MTGPIAAFAFDLDDTLAPSKRPISAEMAFMLTGLLADFHVCVITGGSFTQIREQVVGRMPESPWWERLHLMPTSGACHYFWEDDEWTLRDAETLSSADREAAIDTLQKHARVLGLWADEFWGPPIEDRGTQITFSALGQDAPLDVKRGWDPDGSKRALLRDAVQASLPHLEVRSGGSTSVDVTKAGIDKAFGIGFLLRVLGLDPEQLVFFGDRLDPGGNDFPVTTLGVRCIAVDGPADTLRKVAAVRAELSR
jgi:HAD superfamily hydrolase (TIGR01484 family)